MKKSNGILLALIAATLWGVSGVSGQFLFERREINPEWLVTIRLLMAGGILLGYAHSKRIDIWAIWRNNSDIVQLLIFASLGMVALQYTYFNAIKLSNAATATVLQFIGPIFIIGYIALKTKKAPSTTEWLSLGLATLGIFLLVSHGNVRNLTMSLPALLWGVASALFLAVYTIQPMALFQKYHSAIVVGWGMLLGGVILNFFCPVWQVTGIWDKLTILNLTSVILFGGVIAFFCFGEAIKIIGAHKSSIVITAEPLAASIFAILFLNVSFGFMDWTGSGCILLGIMLLSLKKKESDNIQLNI